MADSDLGGLPEANDLDNAFGDITPGGKLFGPGLTPGTAEQVALANDDGSWVDSDGKDTDYAGADPNRSSSAAADVPKVSGDYKYLIEKLGDAGAKVADKLVGNTAGVPGATAAAGQGAYPAPGGRSEARGPSGATAAAGQGAYPAPGGRSEARGPSGATAAAGQGFAGTFQPQPLRPAGGSNTAVVIAAAVGGVVVLGGLAALLASKGKRRRRAQ